MILLTFISASVLAQSPACESAIRKRFSGESRDRYGISSAKKISMFRYMTTYAPGMHKYGNNNALLYDFLIDEYENNQLKDRVSMTLLCVVNSSGKVLGLERDD